MIPIKIKEYVHKYCKDNPKADSQQLKESLQQAVQDKKNGATCFHCGKEIWAIGSAAAYHGCFSCLTGESDSSEDYEIKEVCWS